MKGVELPINILVIVAIAIIVLLGLIALYFLGWNPFQMGAGLEGIKNEACAIMVRRGCKDSSSDYIFKFDGNELTQFDADQDGLVGGDEENERWVWDRDECGKDNDKADSLAALCQCFYNKNTEVECKKLCGCVVV